MSRQLLVSIHAGSGLLGLVVGLAVFAPPERRDVGNESGGLLMAGSHMAAASPPVT